MEKFLARQPIFDGSRVVYGYELLFRYGPENYFSHPQPDVACASTTDNLFLFGLEKLTQGRRAFINCTREFLIRGYPTLLPKDRVVIEVLENISLDQGIVDACQQLKRSGYLIALDDFVQTPAWKPLVDLADFIKVDVLASSPAEQRRLSKEFEGSAVRLVAEKVENYEVFQRTRNWGYVYFQGYFFSRPEMLTHHDVPAHKLTYLRILQAANQKHIDMGQVAERIKSEASLSYRLLRYLNSPAFFLASEVRSIPHCLALLGERGTRKWVSLVAVACMTDGKPEELVTVPLIRARFCELLAPAAGLGDSADDLFLLGLLSAIDAVLDMKMDDVLKEIKIRQEISDALLGKENRFREILEIVLCYEKGQWQEIDRAAKRWHIHPDKVPELFMQSLEWMRGLTSGQEIAVSEES